MIRDLPSRPCVECGNPATVFDGAYEACDRCAESRGYDLGDDGEKVVYTGG